MKIYEDPSFELITFPMEDIVTSSPGVCLTGNETDIIWNN